jgi:YtcA family
MTRSKSFGISGQTGAVAVPHATRRSVAGPSLPCGAARGWCCCLLLLSLSGCARAPSFVLFGAFFPAWMFCALVGLVAAIVVRAAFLATGLAARLPYQLFVCTAIGTLAAVLPWLLVFAR